jgi:hypothetical protein
MTADTPHDATTPEPAAEAALIGALAETESEYLRSVLMRRTLNIMRRAGDTLVGRRLWSTKALAARVMSIVADLRIHNGVELRQRYPGHTPHQIADELIGKAARAAGAVGAATGAGAFLPVPLAWPVQLASESIVVICVEIKMVAELHEVYGAAVPGPPRERARAYAGAWARQRSATPSTTDATLAAGSAVGRRLRHRVALRTGRDVVSLGPLLSGAALGARVNYRETLRVGRRIRRDLERRSNA